MEKREVNIPMLIGSFSHKELESIGRKIFEHLGFRETGDTVFYGGRVDLAGKNDNEETIAFEAGNLSIICGSEEQRVANILMKYDYYIHLPYILSYVPDEEGISRSILDKRTNLSVEIRHLQREKEHLVEQVCKLRKYVKNITNIIDTCNDDMKLNIDGERDDYRYESVN